MLVTEAIDADFEVTKPSYTAAQETFQFFTELKRRRPDDPEVLNALECARSLLTHLWKERNALLGDSV